MTENKKQERETIKTDIMVQLDEVEKLKYTSEYFSTLNKKEKLEDEKKKKVEEYKNKIGGLESRLTELKRAIETGEEFREVECYYEMDYPSQQKHLRRADNDEIVESITMTKAELQQNLEYKEEDEPSEEQTEEQSDADKPDLDDPGFDPDAEYEPPENR